MKLPDRWFRAVPVFDDEHLVSCVGLVPVIGLAEQTGLVELIGQRVRFKASKVASAGVNPAGKLTAIAAGMAAGADSIDDLDVIRAGGMRRLFAGVYAPATLGQFLRDFTHGHTLQLASVLRAHLVNLIEATDLLPGIAEQVFVDVDSLLRPVYGHAKQGASYGHTKIAGKQVLRKGLSPLATTLSTPTGAPVLAGLRLRAGKAGSGKGAATMVAEAVRVARQAGATGAVLVRGDSAYGNSLVVAACRLAGARFSLVLVKNQAVTTAIAAIPEDAWTPVQYPGAVHDAGQDHRCCPCRSRGRGRCGTRRRRRSPRTSRPGRWRAARTRGRSGRTRSARRCAAARLRPASLDQARRLPGVPSRDGGCRRRSCTRRRRRCPAQGGGARCYGRHRRLGS